MRQLVRPPDSCLMNQHFTTLGTKQETGLAIGQVESVLQGDINRVLLQEDVHRCIRQNSSPLFRRIKFAEVLGSNE